MDERLHYAESLGDTNREEAVLVLSTAQEQMKQGTLRTLEKITVSLPASFIPRHCYVQKIHSKSIL